MDVAASEFLVEGQDCYDLGKWYPEAEVTPELKMTGAQLAAFYIQVRGQMMFITSSAPPHGARATDTSTRGWTRGDLQGPSVRGSARKISRGSVDLLERPSPFPQSTTHTHTHRPDYPRPHANVSRVRRCDSVSSGDPAGQGLHAISKGREAAAFVRGQ